MEEKYSYGNKEWKIWGKNNELRKGIVKMIKMVFIMIWNLGKLAEMDKDVKMKG